MRLTGNWISETGEFSLKTRRFRMLFMEISQITLNGARTGTEAGAYRSWGRIVTIRGTLRFPPNGQKALSNVAYGRVRRNQISCDRLRASQPYGSFLKGGFRRKTLLQKSFLPDDLLSKMLSGSYIPKNAFLISSDCSNSSAGPCLVIRPVCNM